MSESDANDRARKKAQKYFTQTEQRDKLVKEEVEKERAASDAKTAKLRALRLAKEAADRIESERIASERAAAGIKAPARRKSKKA